MKVLTVFIYALIFAERCKLLILSSKLSVSAPDKFFLLRFAVGRRKMVLIGGSINIACVTWVAIYRELN